MINKEIYIKNIAAALAFLSKEVEILNCVNFYDINIVAEDFYAQFLNKIYGYNLCNLNDFEKNAPAIDLADEALRISIQVTSDNDSEKIKDTIKKFIEHDQFLKYDRLVILILTKKKNYSTKFDTENRFSFDKKKDIIDYTDLIKDIKLKDINTLKKISKFLEEGLISKIQNTKATQASEVDTIIDLIEYITKNREKKDKRDTVIDPEYKIEKRFREFADRLKDNYITLYTIYGEALEMVNTMLEIDEAQDLITVMYLQDISIQKLDEASSNPVKALELLVDYFGEKLSQSGKKYDKAAIRFYLVNELIKCNVFPNERSDYNDDK
ncbi:MAG: SMEK domain-containing protein [Angelakisella sp.]|nr:SMEK domain-containing protein [Angelakisella sp.]